MHANLFLRSVEHHIPHVEPGIVWHRRILANLRFRPYVAVVAVVLPSSSCYCRRRRRRQWWRGHGDVDYKRRRCTQCSLCGGVAWRGVGQRGVSLFAHGHARQHHNSGSLRCTHHGPPPPPVAPFRFATSLWLAVGSTWSATTHSRPAQWAKDRLMLAPASPWRRLPGRDAKSGCLTVSGQFYSPYGDGAGSNAARHAWSKHSSTEVQHHRHGVASFFEKLILGLNCQPPPAAGSPLAPTVGVERWHVLR